HELRLGGVVLTLVVDGRVREVRRVVADLPERPALLLDGLGEVLRCPGDTGAVEDVDGDRVVGDADFALTRRGLGRGRLRGLRGRRVGDLRFGVAHRREDDVDGGHD